MPAVNASAGAADFVARATVSAARYRDGEAMCPEEVAVERGVVLQRPAEDAHQRGRDRDLAYLQEAEQVNGITRRRARTPKAVLGGIAQPDQLGSESLVGADYARQLIRGRVRILHEHHDASRHDWDRGKIRQFADGKGAFTWHTLMFRSASGPTRRPRRLSNGK